MTGARAAEPEHVVVLPGNTWAPLVAAVFTGVFFVSVLVKAYAVALAAVVLTVATFIVWAWETGGGARGETVRAGGGGSLTLPLHWDIARSPGWWGTALTLLADAALFASLLFAYFFLWTVSPAWPPDTLAPLDGNLPAVALALLVIGSAAVHRRREWAAAALGLVAIMLVGSRLVASPLAIAGHAHDALVFTIWIFALVHVAIASVMTAFVSARARKYGARQPRAERAVAALFWHYTVVQCAAAYAVVHLLRPVFAP